MNWPAAGPMMLPTMNRKILTAKVLTGGRATVEQTDNGIAVRLPVAQRDDMATVICLTIDGNATEIAPVKVAATGS